MDGSTDDKAPLNPGQNETADVNVNPSGANSSDPSDKLTPDHPRFKQVLEERNELRTSLADLKQEMAELREQISTRQTKENSDELTQDEISAMEKIDRQLKARGYVTKEVLESTSKQQRTAAQMDKLESKYNGENGYPKFDPIEVLEYSRKRNIPDLEDAYNLLHQKAIIQVEAKRQMTGVNAPTSEKPTKADRQSPTGELTPADIKEMSDAEYLKNREKIFASMRGK